MAIYGNFQERIHSWKLTARVKLGIFDKTFARKPIEHSQLSQENIISGSFNLLPTPPTESIFDKFKKGGISSNNFKDDKEIG